MSKVDKIKGIVASSGAKIMSVKFIKKDGSERTMSFNPKTAKGIKGEDASPSAKQAVETNKKNNPHLIRVCDQTLLAKGDAAEKCWRTVDCNKVFEVHVNGEVIPFGAE